MSSRSPGSSRDQRRTGAAGRRENANDRTLPLSLETSTMGTMTAAVHATFLITAPDQPGLVARFAGFFYNAGLNIVDASNHTDAFTENGPRFFMRLVVDLS